MLTNRATIKSLIRRCARSLVLYMVIGEISIYPFLIFLYFLINFAWYAIIIAAETEDRGNKSNNNQSTNLLTLSLKNCY